MDILPGPLKYGFLLSKLWESYTEGSVKGRKLILLPQRKAPGILPIIRLECHYSSGHHPNSVKY